MDKESAERRGRKREDLLVAWCKYSPIWPMESVFEVSPHATVRDSYKNKWRGPAACVAEERDEEGKQIALWLWHGTSLLRCSPHQVSTSHGEGCRSPHTN